ncbi:hypothetical protein ACVWXQ_008940 [Bradyrhizobium sp. S3.14.4]
MTKPSSRRIDPTNIERAQAVSVAAVAVARGLVLRKAGGELVGGCPLCGGRDRFAISVAKNVFNCRGCGGKGNAISLVMWLDSSSFIEAVEVLTGGSMKGTGSASCPGCSGGARPARTEIADHDRRQHQKAAWLWSRRKPITGTIAETYLREVRGIACPLPPTIGFLPPARPEHRPAMIAAFGLCDEVEPGIILAPRELLAVHLTLLKPDGSGKAEVEKPDSSKLIIGSPSVEIQRGGKTEKIGRPIVLATPTDLLGLAITEGIEDALTVHQALGLGAWAAGSAPHLGKLGEAVPGYIDAVTIFADADADHQGERAATRLASRLRERGIEAIIEGLDR